MFIDKAEISVKAGSGGNGCISFYRDKYTRYAIRDGGNGGGGGNIRIVTSKDIDTLLDYRYKRHFKARNGGHGSSNKKTGSMGADAVIMVPVGTIVRDADTGLTLRDLTEEGQTLIAAKGGRGARGNAVLPKGVAGDKNRGEEGESRNLTLELKLIADAAIVGLPNAGKSSLISLISAAHPRIAPFAFTTKSPVMGIVKFDDTSVKVLDVPGLIEGAHAGRGLGDGFLRHIDRCRALIHIIDISPAADKDPYDSYNIINNELDLYKEGITKRPAILVANKMDLPGSADNLKVFKERDGIPNNIIAVSCKTGEGIDGLLTEIRRLFSRGI